jgi:hypothetical protein
MAKLSTESRKAMPQSEYALPGKRFPMPDASHARSALSGATRALHVGNITAEQAAHVRKVADRKLGFSRGQMAHDNPRQSTAQRTP